MARAGRRPVTGAIDTKTTDTDPYVDERREAVARLVATKASLRTIARVLAENKKVNPKTGEPWSHETIREDIRALRKEWRARAAQKTDAWIQEEIASLDALQQAAWGKGDFGAVLGAMRQRAALLGLNAPTKLEYSLPPELVAMLKELGIKPSDTFEAMMQIAIAAKQQRETVNKP